MAEPWARNIGQLADMDGKPLTVGVDYDTVTIGPSQYTEPIYMLTREMAEEFAHLFVSACWAAGENAERMREKVFGPVSGASRKIGRDWCRVRPGVQARLLSFGGVNDEAFAWIDVRPEGEQVSPVPP